MKKEELIKKCIVFRMLEIQGENATSEEKEEWRLLNNIIELEYEDK